MVVLELLGSAAVGFGDGHAHGIGHGVGVKNRLAVKVARGAAHGLDERARRAQKPFLVGVENCNQGNLRQVQSLAQEIDPDEHVEFPAA